MKIATTPNYILPYVKSVPLRNDVSKALIAGGVFEHDPDKVVWALPNAAPPTPTADKPPAEIKLDIAKLTKPMTPAEMQALIGRIVSPKPGLGLNLTGQFPAVTPKLSLSSVALPAGGNLHPIEVSKRGSKKVTRAFGLAEAALPLATEFSKNPNVGHTADAVAGVLAGAELVFELVNPKDRTALERAFFFGQKGASVLNTVADFVPGLHAAKPALTIAITLMKVGDEVRLCIQPEDQKAGTKK